MRTKALYGTGVAIITPFDKNKNIDFNALEKLALSLIKNGVNYLVPIGTTGEAATLSTKEKAEILNFLYALTPKNIPIVVGVGGNNTTEVINQLNTLPLRNATAILSVSPYYNKPSQNGIFEHYNLIAKNSPKPIVLYNVPGRTSSNMHYSTTIKLAEKNKNIVGIKEASGNINQAYYLKKYCPQNFTLISGDDALTIPLIAMGFHGTISVVANAFPSIFSSVVQYSLKGNFTKANQEYKKIMELVDFIFLENNPAGIKAVLHFQKIIQNELRLPLSKLSDSLYKTLPQLLLKNKLN